MFREDTNQGDLLECEIHRNSKLFPLFSVFQT
jgi:hypothetical protein